MVRFAAQAQNIQMPKFKQGDTCFALAVTALGKNEALLKFGSSFASIVVEGKVGEKAKEGKSKLNVLWQIKEQRVLGIHGARSLHATKKEAENMYKKPKATSSNPVPSSEGVSDPYKHLQNGMLVSTRARNLFSKTEKIAKKINQFAHASVTGTVVSRSGPNVTVQWKILGELVVKTCRASVVSIETPETEGRGESLDADEGEEADENALESDELENEDEDEESSEDEDKETEENEAMDEDERMDYEDEEIDDEEPDAEPEVHLVRSSNWASGACMNDDFYCQKRSESFDITFSQSIPGMSLAGPTEHTVFDCFLQMCPDEDDFIPSLNKQLPRNAKISKPELFAFLALTLAMSTFRMSQDEFSSQNDEDLMREWPIPYFGDVLSRTDIGK